MPQDQTERGGAAMAMHHLLAGGWVAQIIHTAAELGLADHFGGEAQDVASSHAVIGCRAEISRADVPITPDHHRPLSLRGGNRFSCP